MIIQCEKCQTKFRLDDDRLTGRGVKVRCTKCQNVFIVASPQPIEEAQVEEIIGFQAGGSKEASGGGGEKRGQKKPLTDEAAPKANLRFDFESPKKEKEPLDKTAAGATAANKPSYDNLDFSFAGPSHFEEPPAGPDAKTADINTAAGPAEGADAPEKKAGISTVDDKSGEALDESRTDEGPSFSDVDFSFGEELTKEGKSDRHGWLEDLDTGFEGAPAPSIENKMPPVKAAPGAPIGEVIPFSTGYNREGRQTGARAAGDKDSEGAVKFSDALSRAVAEDESTPAAADVAFKPLPGAAAARSRAGVLIIPIIVILIAGAGLYFIGALDTLTGLTRNASTTAGKTVEIETINGFFTENKNFGRLFVIEAKIKNISASPQEIKAVKGIIYGSGGDKLSVRSASPGRVVSTDDLKNLTREELFKPFKDTSGVSIPPKGTVPVMVLFTEIPAGMAEYGVDVIR